MVRTLAGSVRDGEATLVPEVSIGELDGAEEYLFGWIWSIAVDDDQNVYVFDEQAQHVRVFDSTGVYVETLGRRGEGPGEFGSAEAIALLPDGRLVVRDSRNQRIEVFGPGVGQTKQWPFSDRSTLRIPDRPRQGRRRAQNRARHRSGRIWVRLVTASYPVENENYDPENPSSAPVAWEEPVRYDVFEPDGTYLGVVVPPDEFYPYTRPVFNGDYVWAVTRDELGVQRVVRFRIEVGGG